MESKSNSQKHMSSFLKAKIFSPLIMITLLTTLGNLHLFPNHLNLIRSLLNYLRSNHNTLSRFIPTQRHPTPSTIQSFKQSHSVIPQKFSSYFQDQEASPYSRTTQGLT